MCVFTSGVRIKTVSGATGSVKGVTYNGVTLKNISKYGIVIEQDYENGSPTGTPTSGVPITGLTVKGVTGTVASGAQEVRGCRIITKNPLRHLLTSFFPRSTSSAPRVPAATGPGAETRSLAARSRPVARMSRAQLLARRSNDKAIDGCRLVQRGAAELSILISRVRSSTWCSFVLRCI